MKLLDKYILKEYSRFFFITIISLISLFLIVDFFEKIRMFLSNNASIIQIASYFLFSIPMIISLMLPAAILLATLITFSNLSKYSEIIAMKANGISLYRIAGPVLIFSALIGIFLFYFSEVLTPLSIQKAEHIINTEIQKQKNLGSFKQNELWYRSENAIYNFKMFDVTKNTLRGIVINYISHDFTLQKRIDAQSAEWKNGQWVFHNLLLTHFDSTGTPVLEWFQEKIISLPEKPDNFKIMQKDAEKMGFFDLWKYIHKIQSEGYDATRYIVDLQGKLAFPFVTVILVLIGISFSTRSERQGGVMQSVGIGIIIGFSYWIVHAFSMSLGRSGILPSILSAWIANILFLSAGVTLFFRTKT
ncbi:MAG: LPS export ABC transporter permease LptG [Smithella sp.]